MDSFDFGALDSTTLDETLSFINAHDPTTLCDPSFADWGNFGEPMMGWLTAKNPVGVPLGNADLSGGMTDAFTDNSVPGSRFPNPGWDVEIGHNQQNHVMGAETLLQSGESSCNASFDYSSPLSSSLVGRPLSQMGSGCLDITEESAMRGSCLDNVFSCQSMDPIRLPYFTCFWPSCKSTTIYSAIHDLQNHQTDVHVAEVLKAWPGSCSWPGCNSKIFFKTSKRLESHVYNVHITPLCCTVTHCEHKRPFERQANLERHVASKHSAERKYKCHYPKCFYTRGFSRKDKLKQHERTSHGPFKCQKNHCIYGFLSEDISWKHTFRWSHGEGYECDLGSCGRTSFSDFSSGNLKLHLEHDHRVPSEAAQEAFNNLEWPNKTLGAAQFPRGFSDFQDCKGCIEKLKEAASGKEGEEEKCDTA